MTRDEPDRQAPWTTPRPTPSTSPGRPPRVIAERTGADAPRRRPRARLRLGPAGDLHRRDAGRPSTTPTCPASPRPPSPGHAGRHALGAPSATPAGAPWSSAPAPTSTRAAACARSCTASAPPPPPAAAPSCSPTAAAACNPAWAPGTPVLISDHINLTATSPIEGANFVDLTDLYSPRLRALAREVDPRPRRGRLRPVPRPHYETPAEVRMARVHRRRPGRHVHGAGGDRRPRGRPRGARHLAGDQPRRRHQRRAASTTRRSSRPAAPPPSAAAACSPPSSRTALRTPP